jgi:hypothetical protein
MQINGQIDNFTVFFLVCRHSLPECAVVWKKVLVKTPSAQGGNDNPGEGFCGGGKLGAIPSETPPSAGGA